MPELTCTAAQWLTVTGTGYPILKVQCWNLIFDFLRRKSTYHKSQHVGRFVIFWPQTVRNPKNVQRQSHEKGTWLPELGTRFPEWAPL